ncbi:hypothetical protein WA026_001176 [Henosepilachna vigintioctopunctata]|uniref:PDZ domain-containing protein n=1 Tax=Henosepilachna vigintioctopunctata TaxID=420089 RepID=A0AAW1UP56_9CUCU
MSVTDPAIKDLKVHMQRFLAEKSGKISDDNRYLAPFCQKLENIFYAGIKNSNKLFSTAAPYDWLLNISKTKKLELQFNYLNALYEVEKNRFLTSRLGKFRLLLRYCLTLKCLHVPVEYLVKTEESCKYYEKSSILGDEILSEIFLSVLLQCGTIKFELDCSNIYFLETSWLMPDVQKVEVVPSQYLGISVTFSGKKAVIMDVDPHGAAAETGKIEIGDILESINGIQINTSSKGKLCQLLKKQKSRPLDVVVIKALKESEKTLYIPIRKYLLDVNLDVLSVQNRRLDINTEENKKKINREGFKCLYVGSMKIGAEGDSRQIDRNIRELIRSRCRVSEKTFGKYNKEVCFECGELGVKIFNLETGKVILSHSYMDISSCGPSHCYFNYFGYIKGNDKEDPGSFTMFLFYSKNSDEVSIILRNLGEGFKRTCYAV